MPGIFISIEGTDGSGKGTQTELLANRLRAEGKEVEVVSFRETTSSRLVESADDFLDLSGSKEKFLIK